MGGVAVLRDFPVWWSSWYTFWLMWLGWLAFGLVFSVDWCYTGLLRVLC